MALFFLIVFLISLASLFVRVYLLQSQIIELKKELSEIKADITELTIQTLNITMSSKGEYDYRKPLPKQEQNTVL